MWVDNIFFISLFQTFLSFASFSKRVLVHNLSYGNEFYLHVHCLANQTHFHMKGCAPGLVMKQRQNVLLKDWEGAQPLPKRGMLWRPTWNNCYVKLNAEVVLIDVFFKRLVFLRCKLTTQTSPLILNVSMCTSDMYASWHILIILIAKEYCLC